MSAACLRYLIRRQILTKFFDPFPQSPLLMSFMATISLGQGTMGWKFSRIAVANKFSDFQKIEHANIALLRIVVEVILKNILSNATGVISRFKKKEHSRSMSN